MLQMILERLDGGGRAAAVILRQRHEHPAHARRFFPGAVENILALDDFLLLARQRPVGFAIAHAGLARTGEKIPVRHIEINAPRAAPLVKTGNDFPLLPLRILEAGVAGMIRRGADIAGIGAVVFQNAAAGLLEKLAELAEIIFTPHAAETRRIAEPRAARLAGLRIDGVVRRVNRAAREQRIAAQRHAFASGVIGERFDLREILRRLRSRC